MNDGGVVLCSRLEDNVVRVFFVVVGFCLFVFWVRVLLCSPGRTPFAAKDGLEFLASCVCLLRAGITGRSHHTQTHSLQTVTDHARRPVQQQSFSKHEHFALLHFPPESWLIWIMKTYFVLTCIFPGDNEGKHLMGPWSLLLWEALLCPVQLSLGLPSFLCKLQRDFI